MDSITPDSAQIIVSLSTTPVLSYALAHNRINVVGRVVIDNPGPELRAAVLRLEVLGEVPGDTGTAPLSESTPLGAARDLLVDLAAGRTATFSDVALLVDPAAMLQVERERPASIRASLIVDGDTVAEGSEPILLLAAQQWIARPVDLALEMLSAHVLPHHPAVAALLTEATDLLETRTGSRTLPGYEAGPERVDQVAEAVFDAMRARGIRYATPPISWADDGQLVRTPAEVLVGSVPESGISTCLDTTVVMAAALELAGLHPLLWIVPGHAFLGYWREAETLGAPALTDVAEVINLIDLDLIRLVETTQVTDREGTPATFEQAQRSPYRDWLTDLSQVIGVVDVTQARRTSILPLPARTVGADGSVVVTEYRPALDTPPERVRGCRGERRRLRTGREHSHEHGRAHHPAPHPPVEERAAGPQPAQPADQLHRTRRSVAHRARPAPGRRGGPGQRRYRAHPAGVRPDVDHRPGARHPLRP